MRKSKETTCNGQMYSVFDKQGNFFTDFKGWLKKKIFGEKDNEH